MYYIGFATYINLRTFLINPINRFNNMRLALTGDITRMLRRPVTAINVCVLRYNCREFMTELGDAHTQSGYCDISIL